MKSIFSKILLWAIVTTIVSLAGFAITTRLIWQSIPGPIDLLTRFHALMRDDARAAFENGGPKALDDYLRRLDKRFGDVTHSLIDDSGRDLVNGRDRSAELAAASTPPDPPKVHGSAFVIASAPGGHRLLMVIRPRTSPTGLLPYYLWIFLMIAAMGYALAISLARPLHQLRRAVERFGRGDLTTRTRSKRRDEIGELARAFDLMAERTQALMTAQRRLLQDVSHELRSPLARLQLTVRLARSSTNLEAALDRIKKEADRLSELVDELLQVTAAEDDPQARNRENVRLDCLCSDLIGDIGMEAEARACRLEIVETVPAVVNGDRELIRRALENVVRNAIRHAPEGTAITLALREASGILNMEIRDFGTGVPVESLKSIFDPFYRIEDDRNRESGGVGLGLSITKRAVALHNGEIRAENAHPGLKVTIALPICLESSGALDP